MTALFLDAVGDALQGRPRRRRGVEWPLVAENEGCDSRLAVRVPIHGGDSPCDHFDRATASRWQHEEREKIAGMAKEVEIQRL